MSKGKVYVVGYDRQVISMFFTRGYTVLNPNTAQEDADILCFVGGADISPKFYNQEVGRDNHVHINAFNDERDKMAWERKRPEQYVAGICRGGQFANVMSGGSMLQHIGSTAHHYSHDVRDVVWHRDVRVASSHHQMMVPGDDAELLAYSQGLAKKVYNDKGECPAPEFEPEVLYYESTRSLCYQGHPEWTPNSGTDYFFDLLDLVRGR